MVDREFIRAVMLDASKGRRNRKDIARAQELLELGLSVPQVTQIFLKLRQMGLDIPADVYTIPYAVKTIRRALAAKQAGEVQ